MRMSHSLIVKSREQERSQLPFWFHCNLLTHWLCASIGHERSVVRGSHRRIYTISSQGVQSCWIGRIALLSRLPEAINAPCGCHAAALTSVPSPAHHHVSSQQKGGAVPCRTLSSWQVAKSQILTSPSSDAVQNLVSLGLKETFKLN